jgi:anti-anti-sigma regulatory factor
MTESSQQAPAQNCVLAATLDGAALVAVVGNGNFKLAPAFKQALQALRLAACPQAVVDLGSCMHLDSTFMGAIAAAALDARKPGAAFALHFISLRPNVEKLLAGLGILPLMNVVSPEALPAGPDSLAPLVAALAPVDAAPLSDRAMTAVLYDAHDTLARLSDENQARFRDLLSLLRADLDSPATDSGAASPAP